MNKDTKQWYPPCARKPVLPCIPPIHMAGRTVEIRTGKDKDGRTFLYLCSPKSRP